MTTIVYCHKTKQIAVDSRATMGTRIVSDKHEKHYEHEGCHFFVAGSIQDIDSILSAYSNKDTKWSRDRFSAIVVTPANTVVAFYSVGTKLYTIPITFNDAYGSGGDWALAALDFGFTAGNAVRYAATKDNCTGGPIYLYDIAKGAGQYLSLSCGASGE